MSRQLFARKQLRYGILLTLLALLALASVAPAQAQSSVGDFEETPCEFDVGTDLITPDLLGFRCGLVTVPEQHSNPDGPTIRIPVAINAAGVPDPAPDPLFLAQGGPGGDAFGVFALTAPDSPAGANRDIVIFNQRGTRYAEPDLQCEEDLAVTIESLTMTDPDEVMALSQQAVADCRARLLDEGINLDAYDSLENAADIDIIREALGYEQFNFYGVSYGTLLGLHLLELDPPSLRSVILDSVVATQINFATQTGSTENRAYDAYMGFCAEDPDCSAMYPDLEARLVALFDVLDASPAELSVTDSDTGETYDALLTGEGLRGLVFQLFYIGDFYAVLPRVVSDLERGEVGFVEGIYSLIAFDRSFSSGMYWSVFCSEETEFSAENISLSDLRPFIADDVEEGVDSLIEACAAWDVAPLPSSVNSPTVSDTPTLLLSGQFDPITPPSYAEIAAETLSTSYNFVNPYGAHGNVFNGDDCTDQILADFLDDPLTEPDASCLDSAEPTAVVPSDALQIPNSAELNNLEPAIMIQIGALLLCALLLLLGFVVWPMAWIVRRVRGYEREGERLRWYVFGRIATTLTGIAMLVFLGLFIFYFVQNFDNPALLIYGGFPASARGIFALPLIAIIFGIIGMVYQVRSWGYATVLGKLYRVIMLVSLVGVIALTLYLRFIEPLFA